MACTSGDGIGDAGASMPRCVDAAGLAPDQPPPFDTGQTLTTAAEYFPAMHTYTLTAINSFQVVERRRRRIRRHALVRLAT